MDRNWHYVPVIVALALKGLACLAQRRGKGTCAQMAEAADCSVSYMEQVAFSLRSAGILGSIRGPGGGYVLARPAEKIMVLDVFNVFVREPYPELPHQIAALRDVTRDSLRVVSLAQVAA